MTRLKVQDCLKIVSGQWFEYEDRKGDFWCVPKHTFKGKHADTSLGQGIYFEKGYIWRWHDYGKRFPCTNRRSEVFKTKQEAFDSAFEHLFALCYADDRTEDISEWFDCARHLNVNDQCVLELYQKMENGENYNVNENTTTNI